VKITKTRLKEIIKEEIETILGEGLWDRTKTALGLGKKTAPPEAGTQAHWDEKWKGKKTEEYGNLKLKEIAEEIALREYRDKQSIANEHSFTLRYLYTLFVEKYMEPPEHYINWPDEKGGINQGFKEEQEDLQLAREALGKFKTGFIKGWEREAYEESPEARARREEDRERAKKADEASKAFWRKEVSARRARDAQPKPRSGGEMQYKGGQMVTINPRKSVGATY